MLWPGVCLSVRHTTALYRSGCKAVMQSTLHCSLRTVSLLTPTLDLRKNLKRSRPTVTPVHVGKKDLQFSMNSSLHLGDGTSYGHRGPTSMGNRTCCIKHRHFRWPWVTSGPCKPPLFLNFGLPFIYLTGEAMHFRFIIHYTKRS